MQLCTNGIFRRISFSRIPSKKETFGKSASILPNARPRSLKAIEVYQRRSRRTRLAMRKAFLDFRTGVPVKSSRGARSPDLQGNRCSVATLSFTP